MSESKTPQAGEWWEHAKLRRRCFIVGVDVRGHIAYQVNELENPLRIWTHQVDHFVSDNVYLSGCDGWTWKPPEPVKPKPVASCCPYVVSLDTYEKVVAERNALQDRLREIEAKAKFYESPF